MGVIDHMINRINFLLDRLDKIPSRLDEIERRLSAGGMDRKTFIDLASERNNLFKEQIDKEKELKEVYKIRK